MAQPMYRDYSQWILAMEPKLGYLHLTRAQFRKLASALGILFVAAALLLVSRIAVIKNGYQIVSLRAERDRNMALKKQNQKRLMELESLATAERVARRDLRMVDISPNQVITLDDPAASTASRIKAFFGD